MSPKSEIVKADEASAQELCRNCGLCCEGLLHSHGMLKPEEVRGAERLGLSLIEGDQPAFALPCTRFQGSCTIYQDRPRACRGFRCALLRRLDDGSVGLEEALQIVGEARRLARQAMAGADAAEFAVRFREQRRATKPSSAVAVDAERLNFVALALYLDKHFVLARDGHFYTSRPIASSNE